MQEVYIIKIGGNVIDDAGATRRFLADFAALPGKKILVHGGGKVATQIAAKLGIETQMIDGRRITDRPMLEVVTMVYGGLVNKNLVAQLQSFNCPALGLTGADAGSIIAKKREVGVIDYGFAGDIVKVNAEQIAAFLGQDLVPVFAPLTCDPQGQLLNTNADTLASAIAVALAGQFAATLVYCFEKKGVLSDPANDDSVIHHINTATYTQLKADGVVSQGMIPKLDNAFAALNQGVRQVTICRADEFKSIADAATQSGTQLTLA